MTNILGTGLSGLVGSRVTGLLLDYSFFDASLESGVDILNINQLEKFFLDHPEADTLIHFAAFTDTNAAWSQKGDTNGSCWRLNVEGTRNILNLCQKYSKYLIFISTDFVFNGTKLIPYTENDTPQPIDWYGETKYEGEKLVLNSGHHAAVARIAYPFRAEFEHKQDFVRKLLTKLQNGETLNLFDDQISTPTFIDDIALAIDKMTQRKPTGVFHLVASSYQSVYEAGLLLAKDFNLDTNLIKASSLKEYLKTPGARPWPINGAISNEYTKKVLGIEMRDFPSSLKEIRKQFNKDI